MNAQPPHNSRTICFLLVLFLTLAFYDVVFLGKTFKASTANSQALPTGPYGQEHNKPKYIPVNGTDAPVSEEPIYEFIKQNLRRGIVPLWNPHQACGYALIGMLEIGIFYPLNLILYLLPNLVAWDVLIFARLFFAGLFTFWFMRELKFKDGPSLCAAIIFMLSGPMVLLQYWTANVDLLTPLLLLTLNRLAKNPNARTLAFVAISVALTLFGGHPEHVFLVNAYGLAFFVYRIITLRNENNLVRSFSFYVGAYLLGAGMAAIVLFPFLRNLTGEFWHGHPPGAGLLMEEQRDRIITLALPHFFQKENLKFDFTFAGWWGGYLGTIPLALAFLSLFQKQIRGLNYFFAIILVFIIGKEYGLPIINWLGYLPIFNVCRYAIHTPPLAALTVAILAGMGFQAISEHKKYFTKALFFSFSLIGLALINLFLVRSSNHITISWQACGFAALILIIFQTLLWLRDQNRLSDKLLNLTLIILVFTELFLYIHRERPYRFESFGKVPYIEFLKSQPKPTRSYGIFWAFYPNTATGFEVDDLGYFLGLVPDRFVHFVNTVLVEDHFKPDLRPPALRAIPIEGQRRHLMDMLNVRYLITPGPGQMKTLFPNFGSLQPKSTAVYNQEVTIYERETAYPRAYIVHRAIFEPNEKKSLELLKRLGPSLREGVVINQEPVHRLNSYLNSLPIHDRSEVKITQLNANEVVLKANMENAGLIVLSEAYHPDWQTTLDGRPWKMFQANYLIRAVFVPQGEHEIKMIFAPRSFWIGLWLSLVSVGILLLLYFAPHLLRLPKITSFSRD